MWFKRVSIAMFGGNYRDLPAILAGAGSFSHGIIFVMLFAMASSGNGVATLALILETVAFTVACIALSLSHLYTVISEPEKQTRVPVRERGSTTSDDDSGLLLTEGVLNAIRDNS